MSLESVKEFFKSNNIPLSVIEKNERTGTVREAAEAFGISEDEIAKTMGFILKDESCILIIMKGTAKVNNQKFKQLFSQKAKMIPFDKVEELTGHEPGGVCPFGLVKPLKIYLDKSLKEFDTVYPAGGTANSAVKISINMLEEITKGTWIDITK